MDKNEREWLVCFKVETYGKIKVKGATRADAAEAVEAMDDKDLIPLGTLSRMKIVGITKGNAFTDKKS